MSKPVKWAGWLCRLLIVLIISLFTAFTVLITWSLLDPEVFTYLAVTDAFQSGAGVGNFRICSSCPEASTVFLSGVSVGMKVWLWVRATAFFLLVFLILRTIQKIIRSIQSRDTFFEGNIKSFKTIAGYGFLFALLSSFNFYSDETGTNWHFSIPFVPVAFAVACLLLADIFREGQLLTEDKHYIV